MLSKTFIQFLDKQESGKRALPIEKPKRRLMLRIFSRLSFTTKKGIKSKLKTNLENIEIFDPTQSFSSQKIYKVKDNYNMQTSYINYTRTLQQMYRKDTS